MTQQIATNMLGFDVATQAELDTEKSRIAALEAVPSMVRVNTASGYGTTATRLRRFANITNGVNGAVIQGTDITINDSAAGGTTFTVSVAGVYDMSWSDNFGAVDVMGITTNASAGTVDVRAAALGSVFAYSATSGANYEDNVSVAVYLPAGTVIVCRTLLSGANGTSAPAAFSMTRCR